jgi:hypothetical protein
MGSRPYVLGLIFAATLSTGRQAAGECTRDQIAKIARKYVERAQKYNAEGRSILGGENIPWEQVHGDVPYWDIPANKVSLYGDPKGSPFLQPDGRVRVFVHYMDAARIKRMTRAFGAESGAVPAEMQSSARTLVLFPKKKRPFMLKFDGSWIAEELGDEKSLDEDDLRKATELSARHRGDPRYIPEPAGLYVEGNAVLYRDLPISPADHLSKGDSLWVLHSLLAARPAQAWASDELAPALSELLLNSIFNHAEHPVAHAQNLDAHLSSRGRLKALKLKDREDDVGDVAMTAALGLDKNDLAAYGKDLMDDVAAYPEFNFLGQTRATLLTSWFYNGYLGDLDSQVTGDRDQEGPSKFGKALSGALIKGFFKMIKKRRIDLSPFEGTDLYESASTIKGSRTYAGVLSSMRDLYVLAKLRTDFVRDPRAKTELLRSWPKASQSHSALRQMNSSIYDFPNEADKLGLEFGYMNNFPFAIRRDAKGVPILFIVSHP